MNKFLEGVKKLMFNTEDTVIKFKDAKTTDGLILKITEDLVEGAKVEVIAEDGTTSLPKEGELTLEDGTVITVDAEGLITKIVAAEKEEAEKTDTTSGDTKTEAMSSINHFKVEKFYAYITLKDGKTINTTGEAFTIDAPLFEFTYADDEYKNVPVADGSVETADGSIFEVVDGKIKTITKKEAEVIASTEEMSEIEQLKATVSFMAEEFKKLNAEKKEVIVKKDEEVIKLSKTIADLVKENKELAKQPVVKVTNNFKKTETDSTVKKTNNWKEIIEKYKK